MAKRVVVAMSGGVDSSVTALLLKEAGYEVYGAHMEFYPEDNPPPDAPELAADLDETCHIIGIPLYRFNLAREFERLVVDYFLKEYAGGHTPNPCVFCNKRVKFGLLLERAQRLSAECLATGHYARIERNGGGYRLLKAQDRGKDQSYFLFALDQNQLGRILFPLGCLHKAEVRRLAEKAGLPASHRRESEDLCFLRGGDYRAFIEKRLYPEPGEIVDTEGRVLGRHSGLANYTIGQRHGLGLATEARRYVTRLDITANRLVVGSREELLGDRLVASDLSWISGSTPGPGAIVKARIRYRAPEVDARIDLQDTTAEVTLAEPQWAITPGQAIVFYQDEVVLGGGIIQARI